MKIGVAAKENGENASQEGDQRVMDLALQAVYKGTGKGKWGFGKGQNGQALHQKIWRSSSFARAKPGKTVRNNWTLGENSRKQEKTKENVRG